MDFYSVCGVATLAINHLKCIKKYTGKLLFTDFALCCLFFVLFVIDKVKNKVNVAHKQPTTSILCEAVTLLQNEKQ